MSISPFCALLRHQASAAATRQGYRARARLSPACRSATCGDAGHEGRLPAPHEASTRSGCAGRSAAVGACSHSERSAGSDSRPMSKFVCRIRTQNATALGRQRAGSTPVSPTCRRGLSTGPPATARPGPAPSPHPMHAGQLKRQAEESLAAALRRGPSAISLAA
jgi:hypothetical protein